MKVDGQLENAQLQEVSSAAPSPSCRSRIYSDITDTANPVPRYYDSTRWCQVRLRKEALTSVAIDTTLTAIAENVSCDASGGQIVLTLPLASTMTGESLYIQKVDTTFNKILVTAAGGDNVDGSGHSDLTTYFEWVRIRSNGTGWDTLQWGYHQGKVAFTPTSTWVANATHTGFWWRSGNQINIEMKIALTGAPTAASLIVTLPVAMTTSQMASATADVTPLMSVGAGLHGGSNYTLTALYHSTTTFLVTYDTGVTGILAAVNATAPITWANTDTVALTVTNMPVNGWRSFLAL